jgi:hypothetical protein
MYPKGYRGFESLSLRQPVCIAENFCLATLEISENRPIFGYVSIKLDWRELLMLDAIA